MSPAGSVNADDWSSIPPTAQFLFKPLEGVQHEGCHVLVWTPDEVVPEKPRPVALMIHGGGFVFGAADAVPYNQVRYLLSQGVAVVSTTYRKLPHAHDQELREDCLDAYRFLHDGINAELQKAGSRLRIDGTRIAAMGWSAGGYLAIRLASDVGKRIEAGKTIAPVSALVATYPVTKALGESVTLADISKLYDAEPDVKSAYERVIASGCVTECMGPRPDDLKEEAPAPETTDAGDRAVGSDQTVDQAKSRSLPSGTLDRFIWFRALFGRSMLMTCLWNVDPPFPKGTSAIDDLPSNFPPTFVLVATGDDMIPTSHSYGFAAQLRRANVEVQVGEAKGMPHGVAECIPGMVWKEGNNWWEEAIRPSLDFVCGSSLVACGGGVELTASVHLY